MAAVIDVGPCQPILGDVDFLSKLVELSVLLKLFLGFHEYLSEAA